MKRLFIIPAIALSGLMYNKADAQIGLNANINFRPVTVAYNQPASVPNVVYTTDGQPVTISGDDFYYMPAVGAYYDVTDQLYIYFNGYNWIASAYLPGAYRDFDLTTCTRYEIRGYNPFFNDAFYRERYAGVRITDWNHVYNTGFSRERENFNRTTVDNRDFNRTEANFDRQPDKAYNNQNFDRQDRSFEQPVENRTFNRPAQPYRPEGGQFENKAENKPGFQNDSRKIDDRGGNEKFGQNRPQERFGQKMTKF